MSYREPTSREALIIWTRLYISNKGERTMKKPIIIVSIIIGMMAVGVGVYLFIGQQKEGSNEKSEMTLEEARSIAEEYIHNRYPQLDLEKTFQASDEYESQDKRYFSYSYAEEGEFFDQWYIVTIDRDTGEITLSLSD
jgi:uncharacterized protein HemX